MVNRKTSEEKTNRPDISVVVPARNAEAQIRRCLESIRRCEPAEIIVVDGESTDKTREIAQELADSVLSDSGGGVALARNLGAEAARNRFVAFIDVDIELPPGALGTLLDELIEADADAIQAQLRSEDSGDYWSRALTAHHAGGRSKRWFGLVCTVFAREEYLRHRLDPSFRSGEDIDMRYRLQKAGARILVSERVVVAHRFETGFSFAQNQWLADGAGLGRMVRRHGAAVLYLLLMPLGGAVAGILRSIPGDVKFIPYYVLYCLLNYVGIVEGLMDGAVKASSDARNA